MKHAPTTTRRRVLQLGGMALAGMALGRTGPSLAALSDLPLITRPIPSTGKALPVIGVGTNAFGTDDPGRLEQIRQVLEHLPALGGQVVDTAQSYGSSEAVIGRLVGEIGNREALFLATKTPSRGTVTLAEIDGAFDRLGTARIDLMQVHNFNQTDAVVPMLLEVKAEGRIAYVGCSTSSDSQYGELQAAMEKHPLDFVQVDYSIDNRSAADRILPMAADLGIAVLCNMPFGGRRNAAGTFSRVAGVALPEWAADIDVGSWAQFFLKYVVSHPAVTVAIPGMTRVHHLQDNLGAARGRLPDAAMRREMERYWDAV